MTQGMDIYRAPAFVPRVDLPLVGPHLDPASDPGRNKVQIEDPYPPGRHGEDAGIGRQGARRCRRTSAFSSAFGSQMNGLDTSRSVSTHQLQKATIAPR